MTHQDYDEISLDQIVDYKSEYWAYIKKPKVNGHNLTGLCPFHNDTSSSFSVDLKTGKWHCFAEDISGNFLDFYAKINGTDTKQAYREILDKYGVNRTAESERQHKISARSYSLQRYASEKRLPEGWLSSECHLSTEFEKDGTSYLKEPYIDEAGTERTYRKRFAKKELKWKWGSSGKIGLYGEWRLPQIRGGGYAILVEGESDTQSLWYMNIAALGVAGASMFKPEQAELLRGLRLYIHKEPDGGGDTFFHKTVSGLIEGGFTGEVYTFSCGDIPRCKDPSDVLMRFGKDDGAKRLLHLISSAKKVSLGEQMIPVAIEGAPLNLRQPSRWIYSERGITHVGSKGETVLACGTPIIITKRLRGLDTGTQKLEISFLQGNSWSSCILPRSTVYTSRGIVALTDLGATVTSENAKHVVQFLDALETANNDLIPWAESTSTFGWQPGPGRRFLPGCAGDIILDVDPNQRVLAGGYHAEGTLSGWVETMRPYRRRDRFRFLLAAAFAPPLLRIIRQRSFFVYVWGDSRSGKTAGLKAALSAWGDPDRLMMNFNATMVGLERTAAFFCDLPLGIDERQQAGQNQELLEKIVYMIGGGTGKLRGARTGGVQATQTWRTVAIGTGEQPLSEENTMTGVSARVLEIVGGPFENERQAAGMHQAAPENCGQAGPEFIRRLVEADEAEIVKEFQDMREYVGSIGSEKAGSHVSKVATVALADLLISQWLFGEDEDSARAGAKRMAAAIMQAQAEAMSADVNENAVRFVTDWVLSNRAYFGEKAIGTCFGYMSDDENTAYIFPSALRQALEKAGFSATKTLRYMADRRLIGCTDWQEKRVFRVKKSFAQRKSWFVEFYIGKIAKKQDDLDDMIEATEAAASEAAKSLKRSASEEGAYKQMDLQTGFVPVSDGSDLPFD